MSDHYSSFISRHDCPRCDKSYVRKRNLDAHMKLKHKRRNDDRSDSDTSRASSPARPRKRARSNKEKEKSLSTDDTSGGSVTATDDSLSTQATDASDSTDTEWEQTDYAWRQLMKIILREWKVEYDQDHIANEFPDSVDDLLPGGSMYQQFQTALRDKVFDTIKLSDDLQCTPLYSRIIDVMKLSNPDFSEEYQLNVNDFEVAFEIVKPSIRLLKDNDDIVEKFETDDDSDDEEEEDDDE